VSAKANIFGAGLDVPPSPGGGGGGELPATWRLPAGEKRTVTFPSITGQVNPIADNGLWNSAAGDLRGVTNVKSYDGVAGIVHRKNGMFLVGVFLTEDPPADPAPPRLDFTKRDRFKVLAPRIGQTFLVGDGRGHRYRVPPRATRLFVGFADSYFYQGDPGWYGNNTGELVVTLHVARG
jgi:hypothetical protein